MTPSASQKHALSADSLRDEAATFFAELKRMGSDGIGITRECYADGENAAFAYLRAQAEANGLVASHDPVGNLIVSRRGDDSERPALYIGSHLDSVPQGGNYDGAAGVLAGYLCLLRLEREQVELPHPVRLIVFRAEESAFFGRANIGSRALFGLIEASDLVARSRGSGPTLEEAMASVGVDVGPIARGERLFDPKSALRYLELHIEQGPILAARDIPVGVVTGIRGNIRHRKVICRGEAGHSGAVPRWLRKDALFAVADLVNRLDDHWKVLLERGLDIVVTIGIIGTNPAEHAISRIPGEIEFSFEVRSQSHDTLETFHRLFRAECGRIAAERGVTFEFDREIRAEAAIMDAAIIEATKQSVSAVGLPVEMMSSGAGHDAAVLANEGIRSGMIFVRNTNGSHNPQEHMELDDFMLGNAVLFDMVARG